jgi:hypothetical protein
VHLLQLYRDGEAWKLLAELLVDTACVTTDESSA